MNKFFVLTKILLKNGSAFQKTDNRKRNISIFIIAAALLPMIVSTTFLLMKAYDVLKAVNLQNVIFGAILSSACIAMVIFGILYVISIYFFSDDIVQLITMPIKPHVILASKFVIVNIYQYFLEAIILLPCVIAYGIKIGTAAYWIYSVIIFLTLPVIPTVICSLISILLMSLGKFFRNKDRVKLVTGILAFVAAIGINVAVQLCASGSGSGSSLILSNSVLMKQTAMLFPSNLIAVEAVFGAPLYGLLQLLLFLLISAAAVMLFLMLGKGLYLNSVVNLTQSTVSGKKLSKKEFEKRSRTHSGVWALAMKDWKILYRTPAFFLNCVLSAVIIPPIMIVAVGFGMQDLPTVKASPLMISIGVVITGFICIMNMAAPTAISREGKNLYVAKYIPVSYRRQLIAKLIPGMLLSGFTLAFTVIIGLFMFKIELFAWVAIIVLSIIALAAFNMFGLFADVMFPKLDWDDETAAVKRNLNVGIQMIVMIVVTGIIALISLFLNFDLYFGTLILLVIYSALFAGAAVLLFKKGVAAFAGTSKVKIKNNEGKPKDIRKKITATVSVVLTVLLVGGTAGLILYEEQVSPKVEVGSTKVEISAGFLESSSFDLSQIKNAYIKDSIPKTSNKVGYASGSKLRGTFTVEGMGRGHVYTEVNNGPFLYVIMKDNSFTIINYKDGSITTGIYEKLKKCAS